MFFFNYVKYHPKISVVIRVWDSDVAIGQISIDLKDIFLESATRGRSSIEKWHKVKSLSDKGKKSGNSEITHYVSSKGKKSKGLGEIRFRFIAF